MALGQTYFAQQTRTFYEMSVSKAAGRIWKLKRQINSLYYERSGFSKSPENYRQSLPKKLKPCRLQYYQIAVYTFEFFGLQAKDGIRGNDLETALLNHLQKDFMLELGHGFCLEARPERILIGDEYFFIDLVFYHRLLKCHVLIDLKIEEFTHANPGQLNTYLNYYKAECNTSGDNPPVGILLSYQ